MNKIKSSLEALAKLILIFLKTRNIKKALFFSALRGGSNIALVNAFILEKNHLKHIQTGRTMTYSHVLTFNNDISLLNDAFLKFSLEEIQGKIRMSIEKHNQKLSMCVTNFDGVGAFQEILVNDVYETISTDNLVIIDVGMNVGAASLFFASYGNVKEVYGFEPVPASCVLAEENLKLNPEIAPKIEIACMALGRGNKKVRIPNASGGSVGATVTDFVMEKIHQPDDYKATTEVFVKDASSAISEILKKHSEKIVLKLDCEGAEYEIVEDLFAKGMLKNISIIIIEWHYNGKQTLVDSLIKSGFQLFAPDIKVSFPAGLIYAINGSQNLYV